MRLRDACSSAPHPERMLAYEMALAASGDTEHALDSLRHRVPPSATTEPDVPADAFAGAISFLLGESDLAPPLHTWPAADLVALLKHWGARIDQAPEGFPQAELPLVLAAWAMPDGVRTCQHADGRAATLCYAAPRRPLERPGNPADGWGDAGWRPLLQDEAGWTTQLRVPGGALALIARFASDAAPPPRQTPVPSGIAPDFPTIQVYLP